MTVATPPRFPKWLAWFGLCVVAVAGSWQFPLFHVIPLSESRQETAAEEFSADAFVEAFWSDQLLNSEGRAVEAGELLISLKRNPKATAEQWGNRLGLSSRASYWVSGRGTIAGTDDRQVEILLSSGVTMVVRTGPLFGNAIRDGCGLLNVSDFANSQDFNALSSEINRRVEGRVFPFLKAGATVGASIEFLGGVEVEDSRALSEPLRLVPVKVVFP